MRTGHGEEGQPCAVEHQNGATHSVDRRISIERDRASQKRDRQVPPVADRSRRNCADQQVAGDTPEISRDEGQDQHAEEIESALEPRTRSTEREDEGASKVEHQQEHPHGRT